MCTAVRSNLATVHAGQLIGYVGSNGQSTGPHLHLTVWERGYGGRRIDPEVWLKDAPHPGETPKEAPKMILGIDISEHQDGLPLREAKAQGVEFVIIRLCDGTYRDKTFASHLADAEAQGLLVSTYWYLRAPSEGTTIAQQVDVIDAQMGGRRDLGVWIDVESVGPGNAKQLTEADVWAAKRELEKRGYHVPGIYSGAWYWEHMPGGEPSMDGLGHLWVSHYGRNRRGIPKQLYADDGGDNHPGWRYPLGDRLPDILQFGSQGAVAGKLVDVNAFRGTLDELRAIFNGTTAQVPAPTPGEEVPTMDRMDMEVASFAGDGAMVAPLWHFILHADRNSFDAMHAALRCEERLGRVEEKLDRLLAEK